MLTRLNFVYRGCVISRIRFKYSTSFLSFQNVSRYERQIFRRLTKSRKTCEYFSKYVITATILLLNYDVLVVLEIIRNRTKTITRISFDVIAFIRKDYNPFESGKSLLKWH